MGYGLGLQSMPSLETWQSKIWIATCFGDDNIELVTPVRQEMRFLRRQQEDARDSPAIPRGKRCQNQIQPSTHRVDIANSFCDIGIDRMIGFGEVAGIEHALVDEFQVFLAYRTCKNIHQVFNPHP